MSGRLLARVIVGGLFVGHGNQKLFGWSGGPGQEGTGQMMDKIGMRYEWPGAIAAWHGAAAHAGG